MSLVEWNPFRDMDHFRKEMGNYLDRSPFSFFGGTSAPKVDVYQTENDVILKAEIPGVSKEDLDVYIDETSVRLSGQARKNDEFKDEHVFKSERYYGNFSRTIHLPSEIKTDEARAEYRDGILSIIAPKVNPSKTKGKRIDIQ